MAADNIGAARAQRGSAARVHGPIDSVNAQTAATVRGREGDLRAKSCPGCGALIALNASTCEACWIEPEPKHEASAEETLPILSQRVTRALSEQAAWQAVDDWRIVPREGGLDLDLTADGAQHRIGLDLETSGYDREKAVLWWRGLGGAPATPTDTAEAMSRLNDFDRPRMIRVRAVGRLSIEVTLRFQDGRQFADTRRRSDPIRSGESNRSDVSPLP